MFIGRLLFLGGLAFTLGSLFVLIVSMFGNSDGDIVPAVFGLVNGLIAAGVGDLVIDLNYRRIQEEKVT
ncbi:hypothetical protein [Thalassobacillus hwangdonensis]|uniref:Uncharacterized protein n=1 Tax=Thalassobacillus hwangdonensis TaxID=546108 RepID=A0ABW3L210_9BACI